MGVVTEVPRQQVARRVAQLDVCLRLRPMCFHAFESGPELAGNTIADLIKPLFRRVARPNRPIIGSATIRNTPREVFAVPSLIVVLILRFAGGFPEDKTRYYRSSSLGVLFTCLSS